MPVGAILVMQGRVVVATFEATSDGTVTKTQTEYDGATLENLEDAARVLGLGLNLSSDDPARECQRVHKRDQERAAINEFVETLTGPEVRENYG